MYKRVFIFVLLFFFVLNGAQAASLKELTEKFVSENYQNYKVLHVSVPNVDASDKKIKFQVIEKSRYYLRLKTEIDGRIVFANVRVVKLKPAVVAVRDIFQKTVIKSSDVKIGKFPENRVANGFSSPDEVVGKRARRLIKKGSVIKLYMVEPDYKVMKNTPIKVIYKKGTIKIELLGLALQNGSVGDIIEVKNISTGKKILCRVLKSGVVEFVQ